MKGTENRFKSKAKNILKNSPQSMKEFLENSTENPNKNGDVQIHKCAKPQIPTSPDADEPPQSTVRLHVHIRQDLADKLLELVFNRKRNHNHKIKKEASQRAIIEESLEMYFEKNSNLSTK